MYQEKLRELGKLGLIGVGIGIFVSVAMSSGDFTFFETVMVAFMTAGLPYGWITFGKILPVFVVGSIPVMAGAFVVRLMLSILIGWLLYPIVLIYTVIRASMEKRSL